MGGLLSGRQSSRGIAAVALAAVFALALVAGSGQAVRHAPASAPGELDPSFGLGGKVTTGITEYGNDSAAAVVIDGDGKLLTAGTSGTSFVLVRYNANGTLDATFGHGGIVTTSFGAGLDASAQALAIAGDGRIVVAGGVRPPFSVGGQAPGDIALARYEENGNLDPTFGGDGRVTSDFGENEDAWDVVNQPDGKIVVVGGGVLRYETSGALDSSFGVDGRKVVDFEAMDVALQFDGAIVVSGTDGNSEIEDTDFAVARLLADGSPDPGFGDQGKVVTDFSANSEDAGADVVIEPGGKILVAGQSNGDFALARYESDGSLDVTFSDDGKQTANFGSYDWASAVAFGDDGIVVGGATDAAGGGAFAAARFGYDGVLDPSFSGDGLVTTDFDPLTADDARALTIQPDGKIVAAGASAAPGRWGIGASDFVLARYETGGDLDVTFDGDGKVGTQLGDGFGDSATSVAAQADGKIVAAGTGISEPGIDDTDFVVARYGPDGSPDEAFSGDGKLSTDFGGQSADVAEGLAIQPNGAIIVVGRSNEDFAVARYEPDGDLDLTFGGDGRLTTDVGPGFDLAADVAIQPDGKILVAGGSGTGGLALARYQPNGDLDTSFGGDGIRTDLFFASWAIGGVAIQPDGAIVVAGGLYDQVTLGTVALARYEPDGDDDVGFGENGKVTTDFGAGTNDIASDVTIQANGAILVAGSAGQPDTPLGACGDIPDEFGDVEFLFARYEPDGDLDPSFSGDGKLTTDFGLSTDQGFGLKLEADGKIVAAGRANSTFAVARYGFDGTLDAGFGGDGKVTTDFGAGTCAVSHDVALSRGGILLAGFVWDSDSEISSSRFALARYRSDVTAPETTIDSGPSGLTADATPTFAFSANEDGARFECNLDGGPFTSCGSPYTTPALPDGAHTFAVRAIDPAGNVDGSPAARTFTVDVTAPQTTIDSGPSGQTSDSTPTFTFSANEAASFQCRLDGAAFAACSSPYTTAALADGAHSFEVRALDAVGNLDATPASRTFSVEPTVVARTTVAIASSSVQVSKRRIAPIRLRCGTGTACTGTLTLRDTRRKLTLGRRSFSITAGRTRTVGVKLSARGFKTLVRVRRLRAQARVTYRQAAGGTTTAARTVTLRAPRR